MSEPPREGWRRAYRDAPEIFDAFARAEDREGLLAAAVLDVARPRGADVLEIGAGTGRLGQRLATACRHYAAVDPAPAMLALARGRVPGRALVRARGEALPFAARSFDAVVAAWVVAHVGAAARRLVLEEAARVLRAGGPGTVLVESAAEGEFQDLRRLSGVDPAAELAPLTGELGFTIAARVETEIAFEDEAEAERVLGFLCGAAVRDELALRPRRRVGHDVLVLVARGR